jgi:multidrug efflux pump subunit AcrB
VEKPKNGGVEETDEKWGCEMSNVKMHPYAGLIVTGALFALSLLLIPTGGVPLKMLPFDNKNEFQIVVDMPETATLEATDGVVRDLESYLRTLPEVTDFTSFVGRQFAHGLQRLGAALLPAAGPARGRHPGQSPPA